MSTPSPAIPFNNQYARLPESCYARQQAETLENPQLLCYNANLAEELKIPTEWGEPSLAAAAFSGQGSLAGAEPLAQAYAGHQFGHFVHQLGDGRALLLGEICDKQGYYRSIQLKGSGRTAFSRGGDGKLALGPAIREYLVSEAMHALGIPTTRALALVATNQPLQREVMLPGAVLTRVARSFVRVGSFQYFACRGDRKSLQAVLDHSIALLYPEAAGGENRALAFFLRVAQAQAALISGWLSIGFIHGVMNTDNMAISGETIDYGPCAFLDAFASGKVFSSIDRHGRYAYANQPAIALWNLERLAECLLTLSDEEQQDEHREAYLAALEEFWHVFTAKNAQGSARKLGFTQASLQASQLHQEFLQLLEHFSADFTLSFHLLKNAGAEHPPHILGREEGTAALMNSPEFAQWQTSWHSTLREQGINWLQAQRVMGGVNPVRIPRNHQIELVIQAAVQQGNFTPFSQLQAALQNPYADQTEFARYELPPTPTEEVQQTFCGT